MRRLATVVCSLALLAPSVPYADDPQGPSETISTHAYAERTGRVAVAAGSLIAAQVKSDEFLPLLIAVAVVQPGPELVFDYNSFALMDAAGNVSRVADPKAVAANLGVWMDGERFLRTRPMPVGALNSNSRFVPSNFYERTGAIWAGTHLSVNMHTQDVFFFPRPKSVEGVLTLRVMTAGMQEAVLVRFEVPAAKQKNKKKNKKPEGDEPESGA